MSTHRRALGLALALALLATATPAAADNEEIVRKVVSRAYVGALAGDGWTTRYTYDRYRSAVASGGIAVGAILGIDNFGFELSLATSYDPGTTVDETMMARDPLWLVDIGFGLAGGPTLYRGKSFELQANVGLRFAAILRQGCDDARCGVTAGEPTWGLLPVFSIGALGWLGERGCQGVGLDFVFLRGQVGDVHRAHPTSAELLPPAWLVRVTWLPFRGRPR